MIWPWTPWVLKLQAVRQRLLENAGYLIVAFATGMAVGGGIVYWILA